MVGFLMKDSRSKPPGGLIYSLRNDQREKHTDRMSIFYTEYCDILVREALVMHYCI